MDRDDGAAGVGQENHAAAHRGAGPVDPFKCAKRAYHRLTGFSKCKPLHPLRHDGCGEIKLVGGFEDRLPQPFADIDDRGNAERDEERNDQHRHRAAQKRFGGEKPPVSGSCDRLSQSLYGIGMRRCARAVGARHL